MAKTKKHPGTLRQRGDSWQLVIWSPTDKKATTHTFGTVTREEAEQLAWDKHNELKEEAARLRSGLPGRRVPFSVLLDRFEAERLPLLAEGTRKTYSGTLARLREWIAGDRTRSSQDPHAHNFGSAHAKDFIAWRRLHLRHGGPTGSKVVAGTTSNRTLQKDRAVLHAVFSFAQELELVDANPVAKVRAPKADPRDPVILTAEQFEALLGACRDNPFLSLFVLAMAETGARSESEVLWLQWADLDFDGAFVWIASGRGGHRTKGGKGRWVPMTPRLREALRDHTARYRMATYSGQRSAWVFHHPWARRRAKAGERIGSMRRAFGNAARRANLPPELHQHDLRHMRATSWLAAGANPVHVKEALGHADLRTTMGYTHLAREHLRSLVPAEPGREKLKVLGT